MYVLCLHVVYRQGERKLDAIIPDSGHRLDGEGEPVRLAGERAGIEIYLPFIHKGWFYRDELGLASCKKEDCDDCQDPKVQEGPFRCRSGEIVLRPCSVSDDSGGFRRCIQRR